MSAHLASAAWPRRLLVALSVLALLALALIAGEATPETAQAANPPCTSNPLTEPNTTCGMSLAAPGTVVVGEPFTVTISTAPSPPELIAAVGTEVLFGSFPELDECDDQLDNDGDALVNDGCPGVGPPETGLFCADSTDDDGDLLVNDGCPQIGATAERPQCAGNADDDGDGFVNDGCPQQGSEAETGPDCANDTDDDEFFLFPDGFVNDGCPEVGGESETGVECAAGNDTDDDGFLNLGDGRVNDGCPAVGDAEFDECTNDVNDDPGDDPFVNDGCPVVEATEAGACDGAVDNDGDGAPNDGCSQVGATGEAGSFCDDTADDDGDGFINDGCRSAGTPEVGPACANATDDDFDGRPNDGCPIRGELIWSQRASCEEEVQVARKDVGGLAVCLSFDTPRGGAGVAVIGDSGLPPLANLNVTPSSTTPLVELDFVCNAPGSHKLTLTALPDSQDGALYASLLAEVILVKTVPQALDLNFDGVPEPHKVADTIVINCVAPFDFNGTPVIVGGLQTALGPPASSSTSASLLAIVVAASAAAALALGGAAWYARRRVR